MLIVKKFGGTSVANKERIFNVANRCIEEYRKGNDVAGSMELFTDSTDQIVSGSNVSMFTDIMTNLTGGEDDNTSVIPVKDYKMSTITITSISTIIGGLAASIFIPVVLIIIGVVIWAVRRKK